MPEIGAHQLEVAETLIGVGRFLVIFVAARLLAELLVRWQLPTILGELIAGVIIGASGLHLIVPPETQAALSQGLVQLVGSLADVPPDVVSHLYAESFPSLQAVATLGLFALLFLTGLESDLDELVAVGGQATTVAVAGVALPFALGTAGLMAFFHVDVIPAVFAGASMTATSIGITASVFGELKMLRSREGQIVIGAAVLDDILGIVILAVVVSIAGGGSLEIGPIVKLVAAALVFVVAAIGLSRSAAPGFDWVIDRLKAPGDVAVASFVVLTLCCFAATAIGLEAALGAFAAGLILSKSNHSHAIEAAVKPVVALFATIFFVLIGTGMDLSVLNPLDPANRPGLVVAAFLLVVAIAGKVAAGWCFLSNQPTKRLVVGLGMMPRGEVGLIFLGLGTQAKLLSPALEAAILLMVIGTTFLAPVLLRLVLAGKSDGPDLDPSPKSPLEGWQFSWAGWLDNRHGEWWLLAQLLLIAAHLLPPWPAPGSWGFAWPLPVALAGAVLFVVGLLLAAQAFWRLGHSLTPLPDPKPGAELVTSGAYARCRHPLYRAVLLCSLGVVLALGSLLHLALLLGLCAVLGGKARREERMLLRVHPDYASYRAATPAIIPGLPWLDWRG